VLGVGMVVRLDMHPPVTETPLTNLLRLEAPGDNVGMKRTLSRLQWLPASLAFGALALAIAQELAKPPDERTWHGTVLGMIPYDLRPPTFDRVKASLWNPQHPGVITSQPFGVGWSVNVYQLARRLGFLDA
jgi:hypothetical protein